MLTKQMIPAGQVDTSGDRTEQVDKVGTGGTSGNRWAQVGTGGTGWHRWHRWAQVNTGEQSGSMGMKGAGSFSGHIPRPRFPETPLCYHFLSTLL